MLAGRFIGGFAIGQLSFLAPLYQTEIGKSCIAEDSLRLTLG